MSGFTRALTRRKQQRPEVSKPITSYQEPPPAKPILPSGTIRRGNVGKKISAPVELVSTTNMAALNNGIDLRTNLPAARSAAMNSAVPPSRKAPAKPSYSSSSPQYWDGPRTASSSSSASEASTRVWDDVDPPDSPQSLVSPITSPGASLREISPIEPNGMGYFSEKQLGKGYTSSSFDNNDTTTATDVIIPNIAPPDVPKRAPSHTKRTHQELFRKRSLKLASPPRPSPPRPLNSVRSTPTLRDPMPRARQPKSTFQAPPPREPLPYHARPTNEYAPFGWELEQVRETAKEFGGSRVLDDEEAAFEHGGLCKVSINDYQDEIDDIYSSVFDDDGAISTWL